MLNIYLGKDSLPADKPFLYDVQGAVSLIDLTKGDITSYILQAIDEAKPLHKDSFVDRFGVGMGSTMLSTTAQILLVLANTGYVVHCDELGANGLLLLSCITEGNAYFSSPERLDDQFAYPISINGVVCKDITEAYDKFAEVEDAIFP